MLGSFTKDESYTIIKYVFNLLLLSSRSLSKGRQTTSGGFKDPASHSFLRIVLGRQQEENCLLMKVNPSLVPVTLSYLTPISMTSSSCVSFLLFSFFPQKNAGSIHHHLWKKSLQLFPPILPLKQFTYPCSSLYFQDSYKEPSRATKSNSLSLIH